MKRCKRDVEQIELEAKAPVFTLAQKGYDMRQVDAYIDELREENDHLAAINQLLVLQELKQKNVELPQTSVDGDPLFLEKINWLMEQPYPHAESDNMTYSGRPLVTQTRQVVEPDVSKTRSRVKSTIMSGLFYIFLVVAVLGVYLFGIGKPFGPPKDFAGFSVMTVLTRSMQSDIPQHSLIVTRRTDPTTIQIGDDITYLRPNNTTVTHRVVGIQQNYANTGAPGFETRGTANSRPDTEIVQAANVVGLVVFHNLRLGVMIWLIRKNLLMVGLIAALAIVSLIILRKFVFPALFLRRTKSNS